MSIIKRHHSFGLTPAEREEYERKAWKATRQYDLEIQELGDLLLAHEIEPQEYGYKIDLLYKRIGDVRNLLWTEFEQKYLNFD